MATAAEQAAFREKIRIMRVASLREARDIVRKMKPGAMTAKQLKDSAIDRITDKISSLGGE